ncbi:hypothetical protein J6R97_05440 [bacterium]|nr:hypothetical protein [bacterium]
MGMAASQARYLALAARKTNTEYEGQQINQARTALANQSANLFNQLLGLEVPIAPKTTDYTELQYSYTDGENETVLEEWTQLSSPNPDANYSVRYYHNINKYTGAMKQLQDPQVQLHQGNGTILTTNNGLKLAIDDLNNSELALNTAIENSTNTISASKNILNYATNSLNIDSAVNNNNGTYTVIVNGNSVIFEVYQNCGSADKMIVDAIEADLLSMNAIDNNFDKTTQMYINSNGDVVLKSDLEKLYGTLPNSMSFSLPIYNQTNVAAAKTNFTTQIASDNLAEITAQANYNNALNFYNDLQIPEYVGNCELTLFDPNNQDDLVEVKQVIKDLNDQNINNDLKNCFDVNGNYTGGIYSFQLNGEKYFATYEELMASYNSHTGPNDIDGQIKLPYYHAKYVKTRVEQVEDALLETDSNGRFKTVRFVNDSVTYSLNTETVTDDAAYQDAMNEYNYKVQQYEKIIADINAKTSIIQEEDRTLELRLKQLDTEQNALSTEMDAVKKVIKENVDKTFKTFSD